MPDAPGRSCPLAYRYGAEALATAAPFATDTLWVAGGLYGNRWALEQLLDAFGAESGDKALVFNGDFHWLDADPAEFGAINEAVLGFGATRGNVESELAVPNDMAGCGCGYPEWVGDGEVERSNRILQRLRGAARQSPAALAALGQLPMFAVAAVGGDRVAIVHGDADALAGWSFSQERLAQPQGWAHAWASVERAGARVIASSHTCLPVLQTFGGDELAIVNNGAAGMPNFAGTRFGLATRISVRPRAGALYAVRIGRLHVEAHRVAYDHAAWRERFLELWPEASDAHQSYYGRIANGPRYTIADALRRGAPARARRTA